MYYVYVIFSTSRQQIYKGHTNNLERRLWEHNNDRSKYTRGKGPWKLVYKERYETRGEAMRREKFLKSGKGRELLKQLIPSLSVD